MPNYAIAHDGKVYTPDGRADIADVEAHNTAIEAAELAAWAAKPEYFYGYVSDKPDLTTFCGKALGRITRRKYYRNYLTGYRMCIVWISGNNGARYCGRFGSDWSQFVRIRRVKGH